MKSFLKEQFQKACVILPKCWCGENSDLLLIFEPITFQLYSWGLMPAVFSKPLNYTKFQECSFRKYINPCQTSCWCVSPCFSCCCFRSKFVGNFVHLNKHGTGTVSRPHTQKYFQTTYPSIHKMIRNLFQAAHSYKQPH